MNVCLATDIRPCKLFRELSETSVHSKFEREFRTENKGKVTNCRKERSSRHLSPGIETETYFLLLSFRKFDVYSDSTVFLLGMEVRNSNNFKLTENRIYLGTVFASSLTFCTGNGDRRTSCLWRYRKLEDRRNVLSRWRHDVGVTCSCNRQDTILSESGSFTGTKHRSSDQQRYRTSQNSITYKPQMMQSSFYCFV